MSAKRLFVSTRAQVSIRSFVKLPRFARTTGRSSRPRKGDRRRVPQRTRAPVYVGSLHNTLHRTLLETLVHLSTTHSQNTERRILNRKTGTGRTLPTRDSKAHTRSNTARAHVMFLGQNQPVGRTLAYARLQDPSEEKKKEKKLSTPIARARSRATRIEREWHVPAPTRLLFSSTPSERLRQNETRISSHATPDTRAKRERGANAGCVRGRVCGFLSLSNHRSAERVTSRACCECRFLKARTNTSFIWRRSVLRFDPGPNGCGKVRTSSQRGFRPLGISHARTAHDVSALRVEPLRETCKQTTHRSASPPQTT